MFLGLPIAVLLLLISSAISERVDVNANNDYYVAGVLEYHPFRSSVSHRQSVENNLRAYLEFIELAKTKNVDILVFPEATLNYLTDQRKVILEDAIAVPQPENKIAPCDHPQEFSDVLVALSKAAKDNRIYVLVNLVEKVPCSTDPAICKLPYNTHTDGYSLYNTNVVFDRYGRVISKYRKINLFIEPLMDEPLSQPPAVFETDFNVKFGHFICFDILFKNPAKLLLEQENVKHILYPTYWFSELPFFAATTTQQTWAMVNNVNLLAAGGNNPSTGTTGTGIYVGRKGFETMVMCSDPIRKLYTAKVPKDNSKILSPTLSTAVSTECSSNMLKLDIREHWADQSPTVFPIENPPKTVCVNGDDICCTFEIKMKTRNPPPGKLVYKYVLTVNYTTQVYARTKNLGQLACAVITCTGNSPKTCGRRFKSNNVFQATEFEYIKIKAKVKSNSFDDIMVLPDATSTGLLPIDKSIYSLTSSNMYKDNKYHLILTDVNISTHFFALRFTYKDYIMETTRTLPDFLTFGMIGRDFRLDH